MEGKELNAARPGLLSGTLANGQCNRKGKARFVGIDIGAETIKLVELVAGPAGLCVGRKVIAEHGKNPGPRLIEMLADWDLNGAAGAAVTGRLARQVCLPRVPTKQAQTYACRFLFPDHPMTVAAIGSHGFSILELRSNGHEIYRENSRCSQGTGNFLRQLVERFSLGIEKASELAAVVKNPAPLSARCPVILKTDMTHLANKGENPAHILAGLFDAVCENVLGLLKPGRSPARVLLIGGVSRSLRVRETMSISLAAQEMTLEWLPGDDGLCFEALGAAVVASRHPKKPPALKALLRPAVESKLERVPSLRQSLPNVRRMPAVNGVLEQPANPDVILGFDIGSTGSKLVALNKASLRIVWEGYLRTSGNPVGASQQLLRRFQEEAGHKYPVRALGVTGSGREIVGSLMTTCYGAGAVYILNEIAAHAAGAVHYDPRVDTIFEIGGQDAKYIRLAEGRVIDCAMNEACSAGTGSFIEEQGGKFSGIEHVSQLSDRALDAESGISLGQHCSVFMAEIIDEAVAAGADQGSIIAGLYDSVVQNYLHRVKGNRSVGQVIFCQGMPFASDALAAAVARQTASQVVVPPNPGTVGALGIALLTGRHFGSELTAPLDPDRYLKASLEQKETFVCKSATGCGGAGNRCRIDSIRTSVAGQRQRFSWGGACSLYDKGARKAKLPDLSPNPFHEREELFCRLLERLSAPVGTKSIALSDEFILKGLFPFFATFLHRLGFKLVVERQADHAALKRGIKEANIPFCAPMQLHHGIAARMAESGCDYLFLPMVCEIPSAAETPRSRTCPIVQASSSIVKWNLREKYSGTVLEPVIRMGKGWLESTELLASCGELARSLGVTDDRWRRSYADALSAQKEFEQGCLEIGQRAMEFCHSRDLTAVVVVGRPYTIYNKVLNSNVPALLREQGAMPIPLDCYAVQDSVPVFPDMYWGYGQRILRAAHQVRRSRGIYAVYCSNYACGPDSFNLHFFSYIMEGKPFAIIETDGHSGDAGTKTRIEAFLHCVIQDKAAGKNGHFARQFQRLTLQPMSVLDLAPDERVLVPQLGPNSDILAATFRGLGLKAETLPPPGPEALRLGRRYTSGKECLPLSMTLGSLLHWLDQNQGKAERVTFFMPGGTGPCRFGVYNLMNRLVIDRLGLNDRIRLWAPSDEGYFAHLPPSFSVVTFAGFTASDLLLDAFLRTRPVESHPGAAQAIYDQYWAKLLELVETKAALKASLATALWEANSGIFGMARLLREMAEEFSRITTPRSVPTVVVVGEIYARTNPFANDCVINRLQEHGFQMLLAPCGEWIEYADYHSYQNGVSKKLSDRLQTAVQQRIRERSYQIVARRLGWPKRGVVSECMHAAGKYLPQALAGEAILTVGFSMHELARRPVHGIVNLGPLECMPSKIAEAQFHHLSEGERLPILTLPLTGDPVDPEVLNNFAFEVQARFNSRPGSFPPRHGHRPTAPVKPVEPVEQVGAMHR